jgi:hypothetical protein
MNHSDLMFCTSVGIVGALLAAKGRKPLWKIQRACVLLRAAGFQARECFEGAKARLNRWPECLSKAERE